MSRTMRIYCNHESHAPKEPTVARLLATPAGWEEDPASLRALKMHSGGSTARALIEPSFQIISNADGSRRLWWHFRCDIEARHNVQVRKEKLDPPLNTLAAAGVSQLSLRGLAAIL